MQYFPKTRTKHEKCKMHVCFMKLQGSFQRYNTDACLYLLHALETMFSRMLFTSRLSLGIKHLHNSFMKLNPWAAELHRAVHPNKKKLLFTRLDPLFFKICFICLTSMSSKKYKTPFLVLSISNAGYCNFFNFLIFY